MKNLFQILTVLTLVAFIAPSVAQAQTDSWAQAQAAVQAALPDGVTLATATPAQIESALDAVLENLGGEAFANLAGEIAAVIAEAQPATANVVTGSVIRRVPAGRVAAVTTSVAANVAVAVRGQAGAPSTSSIVTSATNAGAARSDQVNTAATARAVVVAVPTARAEVQLDLGLSDSDFPSPQLVDDLIIDPIEIEDPDNEDPSPMGNR